MSNVCAIIPARGGSKGIPEKNLEEIDGVPLVGHAVTHAREATRIDRTIVNSDSERIRAAGREYGATAMDRPASLAGDRAEVDPLLTWCVEQIEADGDSVDAVVLLYPTAPLRTARTVDQAVSKVIDGRYDSALSLYEDDNYLWRRDGGSVEPTNYDPNDRGPRQAESWNQWVENKAVYVTDRDLLLERECRLGGDIGYVEMPEWRSVDVDTPADLELARHFYHNPPTDT